MIAFEIKDASEVDLGWTEDGVFRDSKQQFFLKPNGLYLYQADPDGTSPSGEMKIFKGSTAGNFTFPAQLAAVENSASFSPDYLV